MDNEKTRGMEGDKFVDAVLQMAHVVASSAASLAHGTYGRNSPPHLALLAFMEVASSLHDNNREAAERALVRFFEARK